MMMVFGTMLLAALAAPGLPAQHAAGAGHDHGEMLRRGAEAMGFDQDRTSHRFLLYEDGGAIHVTAKDADDQATTAAVRQHLQAIARLFQAGDFGKPAQTHGRPVPGTEVMARLKDRIAYRYEILPRGGRVLIVTRDAAALEAVHAFLRFQIEDHRTGDSLRVIVR